MTVVPTVTKVKRGMVRMCVAAAVTVPLLAGAPAGAAGLHGHPSGLGLVPGHPAPRNGHCVTGDGIDLNEVLAVSETIVLQPDCYEVDTGESYILLAYWVTAKSYESVPSPHPLAGPAPVEDFLAKVEAVRYIVDPDTRRARSYRFDARDIMRVGTLDQIVAGAPDLPVVYFLAKLPPLTPGVHNSKILVEMSASHCDGFGTASENCLPEGESDVLGCPFVVLPTGFEQRRSES